MGATHVDEVRAKTVLNQPTQPTRTPYKPKVVFLNRSYWPDSEATGQLLTDLCVHLATTLDIHVVCGQPNSPSVKEFKAIGTEVRDGVTIHRLKHTCFAKRVPAGRLINLVSFTRASAKYLRKTELGADIVVSETDPFLLPTVGAKYAALVNAKLVCYLQDIYPDVAEAIGKVKPGLVTNQIRKRLQASYAAADRVIVLGSCMKRRLAAAPWSIKPDAMRVIPNWADASSIAPLDTETNPFRDRESLTDKFVVMHSGNMGLTQRLDVLVAATRSPHWPDHAVLLLVGDGAARSELAALAKQSPDGRVRLLPYQPRSELAQSLSAADLHVVSMHENITGCLCPSKLYGILAAGRPVLAIADKTTDLCETVQRHDIGWCCQPGDSQTIAKAVLTAANDQPARQAAGQRARDVACSTYDRSVVTKQFATLLTELCPTDSADSAAVHNSVASAVN